MRKTDPDDVRNDFAAGLADVVSFYETAFAAITGDKDRTLLVEHTFLAAAVLWEGYVSDLLVAYINRDTTRFRQHLKDALEAGMSTKQKTIYTNYVSLSVPVHIKKGDIVELVDAGGNNITFSHFGELVEAANRWLVPASANRITGRTASQKASVNAWIAIRNHIAHRSERSGKAMNAALAKGELHGTGLGRVGPNAVKHVGSFLKSTPVGKQSPRIKLYLDGMGAIAALV